MTKRIFTIAFLIIVSITAFGQNDKEYTTTLKKMFEVSGTQDAYQAAIKQMFNMFKQQYSNVDSTMWGELENEFTKTSLDDLTEMLAPVYFKYVSVEDLQEFIKFYETPVGKKYAQSSPLITQESMQIGQQWGMKIGANFQAKMKEKGY